MRFIKCFTVPVIVVLSSLALAACSDSGSSVPTSAPGASSPVSAVTLTNSATKAAFVPAGSLPVPSANVVNPQIIGTSAPAVAAGPYGLDIYSTSPVDDILMGLPGNQGYFDLNVHSTAPSVVQKNLPFYPITINVTTAAPSVFPVTIQTVSGGVASGITILNVAPTANSLSVTLECGGGNVGVNFSQVINSNANTSPGTFGFAGATYYASAQNNVQLQNTTQISAQPCSNEPGNPFPNRQFVISIPGRPIAGRTYTVTSGGVGNTNVSYSGSFGYWNSGSGTLTVQSISNQTLTFTAHVMMGPQTGDFPGGSPPRGTFTVDLSGTVGITDR